MIKQIFFLYLRPYKMMGRKLLLIILSINITTTKIHKTIPAKVLYRKRN